MRTRFGTILAAVAAALTAAAEDGTLLAETGSAATFRAWSSADATYAVMSAAELSSLMEVLSPTVRKQNLIWRKAGRQEK